MTEKEFENLKVGDKVWIIPWFKGESVFQGTISKIGCYNENTSNKWVSVGESKAYTYPPEYVFQTKVEALQQVVKTRETSVIASRCMLQSDEDELAEAKKELAKAKEEEEERVWVIDCFDGRVKRILCQKLEPKNIEQYYGKTYKTEQEAYEALADYYKEKYEEALSKAGKTMWYIASDDSIVMITNAHLREACICEGVNYDGNIEERHYNCHSLFNSRQEAEAELERRKKND